MTGALLCKVSYVIKDTLTWILKKKSQVQRSYDDTDVGASGRCQYPGCTSLHKLMMSYSSGMKAVQ